MRGQPISDHTHRPQDPSIGATLAAVGLLAAGVAFVANPLLMTGLVLGAALAVRGLRYGLTRFVRHVAGTTQEFSIPGVGRVEYRITPR